MLIKIVQDLQEIINTYPNISTEDVLEFIPIYYPIGDVTLTYLEKDFENFRGIQETILELVNLGITDPKFIAEILTLTENYVRNVLSVLKGINLIKDNHLTSEGIESLQKKQKITLVTVEQRFQLDILNRSLLRLDSSLVQSEFRKKTKTLYKRGHLNFPNSISILNTIKEIINDPDDFIFRSKEIINRNIVEIQDMKINSIDYAQSYLLRLKGVKNPAIMLHQYNYKEPVIKKRKKWVPLGLTDKKMSYYFNHNSQLKNQLYFQTYDFVNSLLELIYQYKQTKKIDIVNEIRFIYKFNSKFIQIEHKKDGRYECFFNSQSIDVFTLDLIPLLRNIKKNKEYLITTNDLYGSIIALKTKDSKIFELNNLIEKYIHLTSLSDLHSLLNKNFETDKVYPNLVGSLIKKLKNALNKLKVQKST